MKRIWIFLLCTFGLSWLAALLIYLSGMQYGVGITQFMVAGIMFFPAIGSILTRAITHEGYKNMWLKPNFKGNVRWYVAAWVLPAILTVFGSALYFIIFPNMFDLQSSALLAMVPNGQEAQISSVLKVALITVAVLAAPALNFIPALGEELGWRGYLLPHLCEHMSKRWAVITSGIIWGLWHAPLIAMGHNYGVGYPTYPWGGILAMVLFCMFVGAFLAYLTFKTKSSLPAAIAHGAINGVASVGILVCAVGYNPFIGPMSVGIIGGAGLVIAGVWCFLALKRE